MILDGKSELIEDAADAGRPQRIRPHQRTGLRSPDLDRDAKQRDLCSLCRVGHRLRTLRQIVGWAKRSVPTIQDKHVDR